ncbi:MAG: glycosyltransferase family 1 protein, partial [Myxococcales bacterium]|nr:glycosyltransferase family 1 protein [Myxococcales bacterium]
NEATRFISPTKTPEYLAAGKAVVSTPIRDVVRPYGERGLVCIAEGATAFVAAVAECLARGDDERRRRAADELLADMSWEATFRSMREQIDAVVEAPAMEEAIACSTI